MPLPLALGTLCFPLPCGLLVQNFKASDVEHIAGKDRWAHPKRMGSCLQVVAPVQSLLPPSAARGSASLHHASWASQPNRFCSCNSPATWKRQCHTLAWRSKVSCFIRCPLHFCRRLIDMGLKHILEEQAQEAAEAAAVAANSEGGEQNRAAAKAQKLTKKQQKEEAAAAGTRHITSFFAASN